MAKYDLRNLPSRSWYERFARFAIFLSKYHYISCRQEIDRGGLPVFAHICDKMSSVFPTGTSRMLTSFAIFAQICGTISPPVSKGEALKVNMLNARQLVLIIICGRISPIFSTVKKFMKKSCQFLSVFLAKYHFHFLPSSIWVLRSIASFCQYFCQNITSISLPQESEGWEVLPVSASISARISLTFPSLKTVGVKKFCQFLSIFVAVRRAPRGVASPTVYQPLRL